MVKARMRFSKTGNAKFLSHLDTMHLFQRAFQRAGLPLRYTEGFNPHPYVSVLLPLPTGFAGLDEIIDFGLSAEALPDDALRRINAALPKGISAHELYGAERKPGEIAYASYRIELFAEREADLIRKINTFFERDEIRTVKRTKSGEAEVDVKDYMIGARACEGDRGVLLDTVLSAGSRSLNPESVVAAMAGGLFPESPPDALYTRTSILDANLKTFR